MAAVLNRLFLPISCKDWSPRFGVRPAEAKVKASGNVPVVVGAEVPPATELYFLPDDALASAPEAKGIKYTVAQNRVVLVDPTRMRVVDVIPP
jgi:Protein of unknown function (DUF1236)